MITEKDLFMFVWYPNEIEAKKFLEIEARKETYKEVLEMLKDTFIASRELIKTKNFEKIFKRIKEAKENADKNQ